MHPGLILLLEQDELHGKGLDGPTLWRAASLGVPGRTDTFRVPWGILLPISTASVKSAAGSRQG